MFPTRSLLFALTWVLAVTANPVVVIRDPPISIPLVKKLFNERDGKNIVERDLARLEALERRGSAASVTVTRNLVNYLINVNIGSPATQYTLILDTGSSNTWIGSKTTYKSTSSSSKTNDSVSYKYSSGSFSGTEYTDRLDLGNGLVVNKQSIGVASKVSADFSAVDGVLGLGPVDLTLGSLPSHPKSAVATVTDNLFAQGTIPQNSFAISFQPSSTGHEANGAVTFGGVDSTRYTGAINYAPRTQVPDSSLYWGIDAALTYGTSTPIFTGAGVIDTNTALLYVNPTAFYAYQAATGGQIDTMIGLMRFSEDQYKALRSLYFKINDVTYELTLNAQIWPRSLNTAIGGARDAYYSIIQYGGSNTKIGSVPNAGFVLGVTFLERFYTVFDTTNNRIGLATTPYTYANVN